MNSVSKYVNKEGLVVLDIFAGDGESNNAVGQYIDKYNWKGVRLEVVDYLYNKLHAKYKDNDNITTLQGTLRTDKMSMLGDVFWIGEQYAKEHKIPDHFVGLQYHDIRKISFQIDSPDNHNITGNPHLHGEPSPKDKAAAIKFIESFVLKKPESLNLYDIEELIKLTIEKYGRVDLINMPEPLTVTDATPWDRDIVWDDNSDDDPYYGGHAFIAFDDGGHGFLENFEWHDILIKCAEYDVKMINTTSYECNPCLTPCPNDASHIHTGVRNLSAGMDAGTYTSLPYGLGELDYLDSDPWNYYLKHEETMKGKPDGLARMDRALWLNDKFYDVG